MNLTFKTLDTQIMPAPDARRMTFTISTGSVDRDNDTLDPKGWQLDNYKSNPVVLFAHDYKALPVAKCVDIKSTDTALVATAEFLPEGKHPFADTVYDMLKAGFLNATSVGFRAIEHQQNNERKGYDYKRQELMEFSIVPIPSNQEALAQRGVADDKVKEWREQLIVWAKSDQPTGTQVILANYAAKTGRVLQQTSEQFAAFEKDYLVESDNGTKVLPDARIGKLCALHGIKEPESVDHTQREALRQVHRSAMDAYANAHHADTVMTSIATMEANIPTAGASDIEVKAFVELFKSKKNSLKTAQGAVQRARDHAMDAANGCAMMGGKSFADEVSKPMPTPNAGESQDDFISRCAGNPTMNRDYPDNAQRVAVCHSQWRRHHRDAELAQKAAEQQEAKEIWLELEDEDESDFDPKELAAIIGRVVAEEAGAQVRAALNTALGRLD